ncbi:MAG: hypothetical protein AB1896_02595 [Thermodesulfobacteriota bacterium]
MIESGRKRPFRRTFIGIFQGMGRWTFRPAFHLNLPTTITVIRAKEGAMSKKLFGFFLSALLVSALVGPGVQPAAADPVKLTYSNFFPPTHVQSKLAEEWGQEVEKRTEGRVVVEYFPGQTLTKANVVYDGVVNELSDIGPSVLGYTRGRFPVMEVTDLPLGQGNGMVATQVANEVYNQLQPKELMDTRVMYLHAHSPGLLHTAKKAVRRLEDIKALKIRCHGTSLKIVEALGGTPVGVY